MRLSTSGANLRLRARQPIDAWFDLESDRSAVALLLALFVLLWTAFQIVSRASVDLNPDLVEVYAWSLHPSAGYYKHPPLAALIAAAWFAIFPAADWSFDLLAMLNSALALFAIHAIARLYLPADKALLVLLLLLLTPFYQFHAQRFASNQTLLSTWPIATYCFLRAFHGRGPGWSVAAGATAGLAMLGKYYSIYLIAAFALAALSHPARFAYLRSSSPWISALVGLAVLAPHLYWLTSAPLTPFEYAYAAHGATSTREALAGVRAYLVGAVGYVALLVAVYVIIIRPNWRLLAHTLWPPDRDHRLLVVLLAGQLLLPALSAPLLDVQLTSLWTMQSWFLLPIILLAPAAAVVPRTRAVMVAALVLAIAVGALLSAPAVAWIRNVNESKHSEPFYRLVGDEITRVWHRESDRALAIVMGEWSEAVTFYSPDHPDSVPFFDLRRVPWVTPDRLAREGYAMLCFQAACAAEAAQRAATAPNAVRREITLSRGYLGRKGPGTKVTIWIVPPPPVQVGNAPM